MNNDFDEDHNDGYTVIGSYYSCFFCGAPGTHNHRMPTLRQIKAEGKNFGDMKIIRTCVKCQGKCDKLSQLSFKELRQRMSGKIIEPVNKIHKIVEYRDHYGYTERFREGDLCLHCEEKATQFFRTPPLAEIRFYGEMRGVMIAERVCKKCCSRLTGRRNREPQIYPPT